MSKLSKRLSKRQRRQHSNNDGSSENNLKNNLKLERIKPKTTNQEIAFNKYKQDKNLVLYGYAGTGKTYISIYNALNDVLSGRYNKVYIFRSVVPTRDMGFLPGSQKDKMKVYEEPYKQITNQLFGRGDTYEILKQKNIIEFMSTSFIRGITLDNSIILIDEFQNMTDHELNSLITRIGNNSKLILCGDIRQSDLNNEQTGFNQTRKILKNMASVAMIEFGVNDIVRSGFVRDYIIAREYVKHETIYPHSADSGIREIKTHHNGTGQSIPDSNWSSISVSDNGTISVK